MTEDPIGEKDTIKELGLETLHDLFNTTEETIPMFWGNYFVKDTINIIAAKPGDGKSLWVKNMALRVVRKEDTFIGRELNIEHGRVLFYSPEETRGVISAMFRKMVSEITLTEEQAKNIIIMPDDMSMYLMGANNRHAIFGALAKMDETLTLYPCDLIVIDTYNKATVGIPANSNTDAIEAMSEMKSLCEKHGATLVIVHHLNKEGYDMEVLLRHLQGAGSIGGMARTILHLSKGEGGIRKLRCMKANLTDDTTQSDVIMLKLNTNAVYEYIETLDASSGNVVFNAPPKGKVSAMPMQLSDWNMCFNGKTVLTYGELTRAVVAVKMVSASTAQRYIGKSEFIEKNSMGLYKIKMGESQINEEFPNPF
jgi:hypothetical protein